MKKLILLLLFGLLLFGCTQYGGTQQPPSTTPSNGSNMSPPSSLNQNGSMNNTTANASQNMNGTVASSNVTTLSGGDFNTAGNVLISDQFNNRIIEVNPANNSIVWTFGSGNASLCNPGPGSIIGSNWAERLSDGLTLIAGTGIPQSADAAMPNGCADNRVIVVNKTGDIVWQYGQANVSGSGPNELNVPVAAIQLPNDNFLITDQGNNRIIEVNSSKDIVWSYGPSSGPGALNSPNSAELLDNGNFLIADEGNNRTLEITSNGSITWEYKTNIQGAAFASRLPDGQTLIVDTGGSRIFTVSPDNQVTFQYYTNTSVNSSVTPLPTNAVEFGKGDIMIADQFNNRVFAINPQQQIIWQYGMTGTSGYGPGELDGPYTGFVIGDYTGQTVPPMNASISMQIK